MNNNSRRQDMQPDVSRAQIIGSRTHGMMDYPMGALLMSAPLLFRLDRKEVASWIPVAIGASITAVAAMTNYEAGISRKIPFRTHLVLDVISGAMLAAAPWLLRSRRRTWIPHLALGLGEMLTALMTRPKLDSLSEAQRGRSRRRRSGGDSSTSSSDGSTRSRSRSRSRSSSSSSDGSTRSRSRTRSTDRTGSEGRSSTGSRGARRSTRREPVEA